MRSAYAHGSIKKNDYQKFIETLRKETKGIDTQKTIQDAKRFGIKVEEK